MMPFIKISNLIDFGGGFLNKSISVLINWYVPEIHFCEREGARTLNQWLKRPLLYH